MARYKVSKKTVVGWETDVPSGIISSVPAPRKSQGATFWNHSITRSDGKRVVRSVGLGTRQLAESAQEAGLLTFTVSEDPTDTTYDIIEVDFGPLKDCTASISDGKIAIAKLVATAPSPDSFN